MIAALRSHWPEYLIEATCLGLFMISAGFFGTLLFARSSPAAHWLGDGAAHRSLMGVAMGGTAVALIYSPLGRRSGAHMNPATTLTFLRLGKVAPRDAVGYIAAQLVGGVLGVAVAQRMLGATLAHESVHFAVTRPGPWGVGAAFGAEVVISALLMSVVLAAVASMRWQRLTGVFAGLLVWVFIAVESPVSGMSMNPARSLGSAALAGDWMSLWVYWTAPVIGMLLAAEVRVRRGRAHAGCAKYCHQAPCVFCEYRAMTKREPSPR
jgi:aquaporin Z